MKFLQNIKDNFLFVFTIFLLFFIPLYPKLPLVDVVNTWVYVRAEDFIMVIAVIIWTALLVKRKISLNTPLTIPIIAFWIAGGISTLHGVLLIFPTLSDVFSNVAFLSLLRRIEYIFLFFVAFSSIKSKNYINLTVFSLTIILIAISLYGFGQKYLEYPAYLTMNEEFAKGVPIRLSELSRVPSTFAGHYDLAAYLVLVIPILTSVAFAFKNWIVKFFLGISVLMGFVLMGMTVSRVSFVVLMVSMALLLFLQKKRLILIALFFIFILVLGFFPSLTDRFGSTVKEVNVLVDSKTGAAIGEVVEVDSSYFKDKIVKRQFLDTEAAKNASRSAILQFELIPAKTILLIEPNESTGEDLPQGTGYINLHMSPVIKKESQYFFEKTEVADNSKDVKVFYGDYLVKRAKAYDLSFTTRFQGEWPKTFEAFKRNIFLGSGYASVTLAVDNNYLRILGESGIIGFMAFASIFVIGSIYIKKIFPDINSEVTKNFILGFIAGTFGLLLNAIFIDVFEASKVAFSYWLLSGVVLGSVYLYKKTEIDIAKEFKRIMTSSFAVILYLLILTGALYFSASSHFFTGDDFTWFRWADNCSNNINGCNLSISGFANNFIESNGFFFRPGTKMYFSSMYPVFWLNQNVYHLVSFVLHFGVGVLIFLISKRVLKNYLFSAVVAIVFLSLSGYSEAVFWVSSTGFLFNAFFTFLSIFLFILWKERGKKLYLLGSILFICFGFLFHELGVMAPLLVIVYDLVFRHDYVNKTSKRVYLYLCLPVIPYLLLRFISQSHWFSGDYSYNLFKLPLNFAGNIVGYIGLTFLGPSFLTFYGLLREFMRDQILISALMLGIAIVVIVRISFRLMKLISLTDRRIIVFSLLFFLVALLPFLGLGNIASRYSYLSSYGLIIFLVILAKYTYKYLLFNGKKIALFCVILIAIIFLSNQLFQLQKAHQDWREAGETSKRFLTALNRIYTDKSKSEEVDLYFVDVPIRDGEAWVFPVGIEDAVWFTFRSEKVRTHTQGSLSDAIEFAKSAEDARIFQFEKNGDFEEKTHLLNKKK